jgi:adenosylcobinamide kinase/adenosylcobinamide-phosphate guanylyltransferase
VTGGARSGKSNFAQNRLLEKDDVVYIATAKVEDNEMADRVKHHKNSRPSSWRTYEAYYDLQNALGEENNYLLDCVTNLSSNIMFDLSKGIDFIDDNLQNMIEEEILKQLNQLILKIREENKNLILVTNELGDSIVPENHISRVFRDIQGRVNQSLANISDEVYIVICGIEVKLK